MRYAQFDYHPNGAGVSDDKLATWWSHHWAGRNDLKRDLRDEPIWPTIVDVLIRPGLILEAGCGPGQWVHFFNSLGHKCIGIDYAPTGVRVGKTLMPELCLLTGDCRALPFPAETFDYIYSNGAVEHDVHGPEYVLREFHRVLKPDGRLMCSVPCLNVERILSLGWLVARDWLKRREVLRSLAGKTEPFEFYQYVFSPRTYKAILAECGFQVLVMRPYGRIEGNAIRNLVANLFATVSEFYNPHMIMAICRKASQGAERCGSGQGIFLSRLLFRREAERAIGRLEVHPGAAVDASGQQSESQIGHDECVNSRSRGQGPCGR